MPTTATCPNCKTPIPGGARFCMTCGLDVSDPSGGTTVVYEEPKADELHHMVSEATKGVYKIERELGRGGMAAVYLATELELHRKVAIKILPPEFSFGEGLVERFQREARTAAQLDHPNIIPIYRVGTAGRLLYFAMKYVEGRSLADVLRERQALPIPTVTAVLEAVGSALAYAHTRGVIHRDIKPANILIDRQGVVLVSDFGIARAASDETITQSGAVVGTPQYMSPEQCAGKRVGPASDQYSLGIVGFEMLTGQTPFDAESAIALLQQHIAEPPPKLAPLRPDAPADLVRVVERAMRKKPEERFASMTEFTDAIELIRITGQHAPEGRAQLKALAVGSTLSGLKVVTPISGASRLKKRTRALPIAAGAALVAAVTAGVVMMKRPARPEGPETSPGTPSSRTEVAAADSQRMDVAAVASRPAAAGDSTPSEPPPIREAEAAEPQQLPATQRPGTLLFSRLPAGSTVMINGDPVTGGRATIASGEHLVEIRAEGYEPFSQRVRVAPGETRIFSPTLAPLPAEPGYLTVGSFPAGTVFVNDRRVGDSPVRQLQVPAGRIRIRIEADGYQPFDTTITLTPGDSVNLGMKRLAPRGNL
ncbi:MAG TPA: protein kinase [Gemmatimonadales bacterium]|nr:protein kinase [Gemmatimonadales bacterium]